MNNQNKNWWRHNFKTKDDVVNHIQECLYEDKSIPKIAKELGTSGATIHSIITKNNLIKRRKELKSKEWLYQKYIVEKLSMNEISKILNVSYQAIDFYLKKHKIEKRKIEEIQKIASQRHRKNSEEYLPVENINTKGYSIWCNNLWFGSAAEFLYYLILEKNNISYVFQKPIEGKRPDYILNDKMVVEIKAENLSEDQIEKYIKLSKVLKEKYNYSYKIINVREKYKTLYHRITSRLKSIGAKRGIGISVVYDDFFKLIK
jgi:hypothetical protein